MRRRLLGPLRRWLQAEHGGATAFGVFSLILTALVLGFAIDATNLYRHQAMLRLAADAAAHAGAATLARGGTMAEARIAAAEMIESNLPAARYGRLLADPEADLRVLAYDPATGRLGLPDENSPALALLVRLQRSAAVGNLIPTQALQVIGLEGWTAGASGVAALMPSRRCPNAGGLVARGNLRLGLGAMAGDGLCLHAQDRVDLPFGIAAEGRAPRISLPDPTRCSGSCGGVGPEAPARGGNAIGMNLVVPDLAGHVRQLANDFLTPWVQRPEKTAFFAGSGFGPDLEPLAEIRVDVRNLQQGDVVRISPLFFGLLRQYPAGLVYEVSCPVVPGARRETLGFGEFPGAPPLRDLVLVTDCPVRLGPHARLEGVLLLLTERGEADIRLAPGALLGARPEARPETRTGAGAQSGTGADSCSAVPRTRIMAAGNLTLPAEAVGVGLGAVAGGDFLLEAGGGLWDGGLAPPGTALALQGFAAQAGRDLRSRGVVLLQRCGGADTDPVMPPLRVLAHVMPPLEGWVAPLDMGPPPGPEPSRKPDLPGTAVERRPMAGTLSGEVRVRGSMDGGVVEGRSPGPGSSPGPEEAQGGQPG